MVNFVECSLKICINNLNLSSCSIPSDRKSTKWHRLVTTDGICIGIFPIRTMYEHLCQTETRKQCLIQYTAICSPIWIRDRRFAAKRKRDIDLSPDFSNRPSLSARSAAPNPRGEGSCHKCQDVRDIISYFNVVELCRQ